MLGMASLTRSHPLHPSEGRGFQAIPVDAQPWVPGERLALRYLSRAAPLPTSGVLSAILGAEAPPEPGCWASDARAVPVAAAWPCGLCKLGVRSELLVALHSCVQIK